MNFSEEYEIIVTERTEEFPMIGIGRRINGVMKTSSKRHRCFNQLSIGIIIERMK